MPSPSIPGWTTIYPCPTTNDRKRAVVIAVAFLRPMKFAPGGQFLLKAIQIQPIVVNLRPAETHWLGGRVVMQRPAKPCTSVRFRPRAPFSLVLYFLSLPQAINLRGHFQRLQLTQFVLFRGRYSATGVKCLNDSPRLCFRSQKS